MPEYLNYLFTLSHVFLVSFKLDDAQNKSKKIPAKHPIIKSESENSFIIGLMSYQKILAWLDMKRKQGKMVTSAEPSDGSLYSSWNTHDPSSKTYMNFDDRGRNTVKCHYTPFPGPSLPCQKERKEDGSSKAER